MTEKQESILFAALELFASEGYHATSTSKVARAAGVSEGLIFRHFGSKEGLVEAILKLGEEKFKVMYADIVLETDPKRLIKKAITVLFEVPESEYNFWKLQFKLKWELGYHGSDKTAPLLLSLTDAFSKLGYEEPEMEARALLYLHDGLAMAVLLNQSMDKEKMKNFLLDKYKV